MKTALVRARPVALVLHNDRSGDRAFTLRLDKEEAARRYRANPFVCDVAAMALEEGALYVAKQMTEPFLGYCGLGYESLRLFEPSYTFIREFLIGELDADPLVACYVAMRRLTLRNRMCRRPGSEDGRGERGWL